MISTKVHSFLIVSAFFFYTSVVVVYIDPTIVSAIEKCDKQGTSNIYIYLLHIYPAPIFLVLSGVT